MRYAWIVLVVAACKYPDPGLIGDAPPGSERTYVVAHQALDGSSTSVAIVPSIEVYDEVDLSAARTFGANTQVFMAGGKVFVAADRSITRYTVDLDAYTLVQDGATIDFVATDVTRFSGVFANFDATNAWYFDREHAEAFALDLSAMTSSTAIYFSSLVEGALKPQPTGAYLVGDKVYMPYFYLSAADPLFIETETYVAQFSYPNKSLITTTSATSLRRGECARLYPFAKLADDTLLFLGDSGSMSVLHTPAPAPNCLRRIEPANPDVIDTGFTINMDDLTSPYVGASRPAHAGTTVITWARAPTPAITTQTEWDTLTTWSPQVTDLGNLSTEQLSNLVALQNPVETIGEPGKTFFVDGEAKFLVAKQPRSTGTTLMDMTGAKIASFPGTVTWIERVR